MGARSKSRKRALDILFAADARGVDPLDVLDDRLAGPEPAVIGEYAESLVRGVAVNERRIDDVLSQHADGWAVDRMPAVDRAVLRIAVYELLYTEVPSAVVIDEAVEAAKALSTDNSPKFINGVLGQILVVAPQLRG